MYVVKSLSNLKTLIVKFAKRENRVLGITLASSIDAVLTIDAGSLHVNCCASSTRQLADFEVQECCKHGQREVYMQVGVTAFHATSWKKAARDAITHRMRHSGNPDDVLRILLKVVVCGEDLRTVAETK